MPAEETGRIVLTTGFQHRRCDGPLVDSGCPTEVFPMAADRLEEQAPAPHGPYRALLAVSEAIASHRDLPALFHELAGRLQHVVLFDYLALVLHEAATSTMRLYVLGASGPTPVMPAIVLPVEDDPAGLVWQIQRPLIIPSVVEESRWPRFLERVQPHGV